MLSNGSSVTIRGRFSPESFRPCDVVAKVVSANVLGVSYCDRPVSGVCRPQFAIDDISSVTTVRISNKLDRIVPWEVLYHKCSNRFAPVAQNGLHS